MNVEVGNATSSSAKVSVLAKIKDRNGKTVKMVKAPLTVNAKGQERGRTACGHQQTAIVVARVSNLYDVEFYVMVGKGCRGWQEWFILASRKAEFQGQRTVLAQ